MHFDLWKKESDAEPFIPDMIARMKSDGHAIISENALVVDVTEASDVEEVPPCILVKSDGATLYSTTDLATIVERMQSFKPDEIIYVVDKRQALHFTQVFRCARKTGLVDDSVVLRFLGFGTMNGIDGKPFKTRDGGVMRLENLIREASEKVFVRVSENPDIPSDEAACIADIVGLAALKYSDLSNRISRDYVFDAERFTAAEGNTGPYIIYTVVRIASVLQKYTTVHSDFRAGEANLLAPSSETERNLMLKFLQYQETVTSAFLEYAPHRICLFAYELANEFNRFYYEHHILSESNEKRRSSCIQLLKLTRDVLIQVLDLLGIDVPERM